MKLLIAIDRLKIISLGKDGHSLDFPWLGLLGEPLHPKVQVMPILLVQWWRGDHVIGCAAHGLN